MLSIEYYFQDSMIMIKEHFQTSRNYSKTLTFDWPHFSREMLGHSPSALWEGKIIFGQYKKSRMQRKVDVLLAQRLHIFLLNQDVLIRNFFRLIFPIGPNLVPRGLFRCDIFPCWIVRNNDFWISFLYSKFSNWVLNEFK